MAWSAIRHECVRRGADRASVERAVEEFRRSLDNYVAAGGSDHEAERVRQHLLALAAIVLKAEPKPSVRDCFRLVRRLLSGI